MNKIVKLIALFVVGLLVYSCMPEEYSLSNPDVKTADLVEGIAYKIEHDADTPNIVRLTNLMGTKYTPFWSHPQGRSQDQQVTLKIPFEGDYKVVFGVQTRGGVVYGDTVTFTIDDFFAPFVEDPMWTLLSGGVGNEKTWYLDLDGDALSRYFLGPLYFYGTNNGWLGGCLIQGDDGTTCWNWNPDYKGNSWLMTAAEFGSMTFDLKGGANVKVTHSTIGTRGTEEGTYMLDVDKKTLRLTDASPLHDIGRDGVVIDWGNIRLLSLTEDYMQLAVLRDPVLSGEGACLLVYNFVSKDYFDNWVPPVTEEPEPPYDGDPNEDLTTTTTTTKTWKANLATPYNWTKLDGTFLNEWTTDANGTPVFTTWAPPYDEAALSKVSLKMTKASATEGTYEATNSAGTEYSGTYTIETGNWINFGQDISFINGLGGWLTVATDGGKLRIINVEKDLAGDIAVLHLGRLNPSNSSEYITLALSPAAAGGGEPEIPGTEVTFDNTKLIFGDIEGNGKLRIEMYNDFGSTKNDPPMSPAALAFDERITIRFTISGITLKAGAEGSYKTALLLADTDWSFQYWGDGTGPGEATVTGDGTYTIWHEPAGAVDGALVFTIDIGGLAEDIEDLSAVNVTVDFIKIL